MLPHDQTVQTRINAEMQQAAVPRPRAEPTPGLPPTVSNSLLPPLRGGTPRASARQLEQRFDLKVTDAPIGQVLLAIVQDTPYSVLLSPKTIPPSTPVAAGQVASASGTGVSESLTVNLKDVTVFEALDAIREMYGYEYTVDGNRIYVQPPEMRTKLYQVNYILGQRRGVSDVQVVGGASPNSSGGSSGSGTTGGGGTGNTTSGTTGATGSSSGGSYPAIQTSGLSSISKSDIWGEMEDAVRTVLGCQIARIQNRPTTNAGSSGSGRADVSFVGDTQVGERMRGSEGCSGGRAMTVNQMSGIVVVRGLPKELRQVESLLRSMQLSIERQVIIEAKIIEVELNSGSQQGINWSGFRQGLFRGGVGANPNVIGSNGTSGRSRILSQTADDGSAIFTSSMGDVLGGGLLGVATPNAFSAGLGVALQFSNFSALINFLESQGRVQVLSSPRIATLNNQKAVLKVGSEEPFVTNITAGTTSQNNNSNISTPPTINYQPFFSGIALDVTPQIDDNDNITLHVHSMVNSITEKEKIASPSGGGARVPFAVNSINETDSVVKSRDGQVIVIGGLMTESSSDSRDKVPLAGDVPVVGALFGKSNRQTVKRELVILLKPTVVKGDETWTTDINAAQSRIERMNVAPTTRLVQ
ncbi:secretin N-terminal domain-containing protein [Ramlibacter sp. WS9]|uniref:secretin N-terminal domain-containing protein n=1 Tax=Ramlibacter sp. WS9 TaxID=1882741 RepID=UPI00130515BC|nr:secretin N-terminal domain-containing protein [Ramlibacter sp. WS9]